MGNFNRDDKSGSRRDFGRRGFGGGSFSGQGGRREMHKVVCSNCGKACEVPFEPTGSKPVYCRECFGKSGGGADSKRFQDRSPRKPDNEQFEVINRKLDKILEMLTITPVKEVRETKLHQKKIPITKE